MGANNVEARSWSTMAWLAATPRVAVPVYQRDYRWTPGTCDKLLQDIRRVASRPDGDTHFIGSILAKPDSGGGVTLVDGQQRITTLQLLLAAIAQASDSTSPGPAEEIRAILSSPRLAGATRLQPHERFSEDLERLLLSGDDSGSESSFTQNYRFLLDRIGDDWLTVWTGIQRLEHVTIELGSRSNAQQIFESLNSTGAPLSDDELIHNYVHMGRTHDEQVELEARTWIPVEEATSGATREFWRDYLILTSEKVPDFSGDFGVFRAFKSRFADPVNDVTSELQSEWRRYADLYRVLLHPRNEDDQEVQRQLRLLHGFGGTPRPFMLAVYDDFRTGRVNRDVVVETFEQLQSLFIRRALVGLERDIPMIGRLCTELRDEGYPVSGLVRRTPEDPATRLALTHGSVPNAGYVLRRLQFDDRTDLDLQIEHIYPQTPKAEWSGDGSSTWGDLSNEEQARYRTLLNTIGNLTLLESHLNQGASNRSFPKKAPYYGQSDVPETRSLAELSGWDASAIEQRTRSLIEVFLTTWPRPSDTPMSVVDDLIKVVDLGRPALRGYPQVFEYAEFDGALWGEVHTSKQLLVHLVDELCRQDFASLKATEYGGRLIADSRQPRKSYERLGNGFWLYTGWAHQYLLEVAQSLLTELGHEDSLRVKLRTEPTDDDSTV